MARNPYQQFGAATLEEAYDPLFFAVRRIEKSLGGLTEAIPALRFPILQLTTVFRDFATVAINQQKNFLAFNKNFSDVLRGVGDTMEGLPGGLTRSLESLFAFEQEGLTNVGKSTLNLANRMQITNQNIAALVNINKKLIVQGTLTQAATNTLNSNLNKLGLSFNVSTEQLISGLNQLGESLDVLALTGGLGAAGGAITGLTARFPAFGDQIGKFVDALVAADIGTLANLGILNDVDRLLAGQLTPSQLEDLIRRTSAGVAQFGDLRGGGLIETRVRMGIIGSVGVLGEQLARGLEQGQRRTPIDAADKIFSDFRTTLETTLLPVAVEIAGFATTFLKISGQLIGGLNELFPIKNILKTFFSFMVGLKTFQVARFAFEQAAELRRRILEIQLAIELQGLTAAIRANTVAQLKGAIGKAGGALSVFGPLGLALGAAIAIVPLLSTLSDSTEKLAEAESDRAKAELAQVQRQDLARSNFEALTADLINSQIRRIEMGESALGLSMANFTERVVEAIDGTTEAVEDAAPEPSVVRGSPD